MEEREKQLISVRYYSFDIKYFFIFERDEKKKRKKEREKGEGTVVVRAQRNAHVRARQTVMSKGRITHSLSGKHFSLPPCEKLRFLRF